MNDTQLPGEHLNGQLSSGQVELFLTIHDPDVVAELRKYADSEERARFAQAAMRLGVLSLRQASGLLDADTVRYEGERLIGSLRDVLSEHMDQSVRQMADSLRKYFDPTDGDLPQRLARLVSKGGDLEQLLERHLGAETSTLSGTLQKHVGEDSALLKMLSPDQSKGVLAVMDELLRDAMRRQSTTILEQFSLDDKESALSRLVAEVTDRNGNLRQDLSGDIETIRQEFSLDNEGGALSRLISRVDAANREILGEFSQDNEASALNRMTTLMESTHKAVRNSLTLDDDQSPLARLRAELRKALDDITKVNHQFQTEVRSSLVDLMARRQESARSTTHGLDFENSLGEFLQNEARRINDIYVNSAESAGAIPRSKVGDHVLELGPETAAAGARIVFEAKGNRSYTVAKALEELKTARENRKAQVGIMVFSPGAVPDGLEQINRWGNDIIVEWDSEDLRSDVFLRAGISLARAMVVSVRRTRESSTADLARLDTAVRSIERSAAALSDIQKLANTVRSNGEKIMNKAKALAHLIEQEVDVIDKALRSVQSAV